MTNVNGVTKIMHTTVDSGSYAKYYTQHSYKAGKSFVRWNGKVSDLLMNSERFLGFGLADLSQYICIHLNGATTKEFVCKDGSGSTTSALSDNFFVDHEIEIHWKTGSADLYVDRALDTTIISHVPTDDLPILFAGQKI